MRGRLFASALIFFPLNSVPAQSESFGWWKDGNSLLEACGYDSLLVYGYIQGVVDAHKLERSQPYCLPQAIIARQLKDVVCSYLSEHPGTRHYVGPYLVTEALKNTWPCSG